MANPLMQQVLRNIAEKAGHPVASNPSENKVSPIRQETELRLEPHQKIALTELIQKHQPRDSDHGNGSQPKPKATTGKQMVSLSALAEQRRNRP